MPSLSRLLFAAVPPVAAASLGGIAARDAKQVYSRLDKPAWAPPPGAFVPVWTTLYALVGVVGWRMTRQPRAVQLGLHLTQIGLNTSWTPLFFGSGKRRAALGVNVLLDAAVLSEIVSLARSGDRVGAALLTPYLAWSGFATALTANVSDPAV